MIPVAEHFRDIGFYSFFLIFICPELLNTVPYVLFQHLTQKQYCFFLFSRLFVVRSNNEGIIKGTDF